jgi:hypothetical protein
MGSYRGLRETFTRHGPQWLVVVANACSLCWVARHLDLARIFLSET